MTPHPSIVLCTSKCIITYLKMIVDGLDIVVFIWSGSVVSNAQEACINHSCVPRDASLPVSRCITQCMCSGSVHFGGVVRGSDWIKPSLFLI
ncbi:hypothetical protein Scep_007911 [Stephania cephalantha]|uniref:Uncharacterized protein n=1 Tax=Stephania cephalantha TaxID=152367 RepID=A0AAP0PNP1_9MAGN